MPGTASTQNTDRDRLRSRSVPRATGSAAAASLQPPILFRLPAIGSVAVGSVSNATAPDLALLHPAHALKEPTAETAVAMQTAAATVELPSSSAPEAVAVAPLAATSPATESIEPAVATKTAVAAERTWWEHWSSGVVLILLIIALVAASIIALNDGGKAKPDHLAIESEKSMVDEFDLSNISIPEITVPPASEPALNALGTISNDLAPHANAVDPLSSEAAREHGAAVVSPAAVVDMENVANVGTNTDQGLSAIDPLPSTPTPLATLGGPIWVRAPLLFASDEASRSNAPSLPGKNSSSMAASNPTVSLELPSALSPSASLELPSALSPIHPTANTSDSHLPAADGASPAFYDGASSIQLTTEVASKPAAVGEKPTTDTPNSIQVGGGPSAQGAVDTNMPSYSTMLTSTTGYASENGAGGSPVFSTASHQQPAPSSVANSNPAALSQYTSQYASQPIESKAVPSSTPDFNGDSIINEYLKFEQLRQATSGEPQNRFSNAPSTATQSQIVVPSPVASSPAAGTGFTLGSPQAGTTVAPPLPQ